MFILVQKVTAVIAHSLVVFGGFCFFQGAGAHGLQASLEESRFQIQLKNSFLQDEDSLFTAAGYLKKLVAGAAPEFEIRQQISRLGSQDYAQRQKAEAYLFSAPVLPGKFRSEFASLEDMEVRYRLNAIYLNRKLRVESLVVAALATLEAEAQSENLNIVFEVLNETQSSVVKKAATQAVINLTKREHWPLLCRQLNSPLPEVRSLSARLMVDLERALAYEKVSRLLTDPEESVALTVAQILLDNNQKIALETLIRLLGCDDMAMASRAESVLRAVTGVSLGPISYTDPAKNGHLQELWRAWQVKNLKTVKLRLPIHRYLREGSLLNGHTLIAKDQNLVIELDSNRQEVFRMRVEGVLSAEKTAEGNYLLFSYSGQWLREYSPEKKINWELKGVKFNNAMPLANGNVLVTVGSASIVREIDPKSQNTVWEFNPGWWPNDAYRLDNGNTLVGGKGGVLEVTPSREIVWEYGNPESATIVVAKPTGKETVLVGWTSGQAREINVEKETVWEYKLKSLCDVFRDPGGNTLFAGATEFLEIDPGKTIVWRLPKQAKTATIRR